MDITVEGSCIAKFSSLISLSLLLYIAADKPPGLMAAQALDDATRIQVSWSAPASGVNVTGYVIYYETTGGSEQSVTVGAGGTEYTLTGLMINKTYSISILALTAQLPSIRTEPVSVTLGQLFLAHANAV